MAAAPKPPGAETGDVHAAIQAEAARARSLPAPGASNAERWPALCGLLTAARVAVEGSVPEGFNYLGRRYFMRVRLAMKLELFDTPGAAEPLFSGSSVSIEGFGHEPGH